MLDGDAISIAAWVAIGCLVGLGVCILGVMWPRRDWERPTAPREFIATYLEPTGTAPLELHQIQRDLAIHLGENARHHRRQLRTSTWLIRAGALLLVVQTAAWVVALIVGA